MGMTNKQFQGFIRLALELLEKAAKKSPDNEELQKVRDKIPGLYGNTVWGFFFFKKLVGSNFAILASILSSE